MLQTEAGLSVQSSDYDIDALNNIDIKKLSQLEKKRLRLYKFLVVNRDTRNFDRIVKAGSRNFINTRGIIESIILNNDNTNGFFDAIKENEPILDRILNFNKRIEMKYLVGIGYKICSDSTCDHNGMPQRLDNFNKDSDNHTGFLAKCKVCFNKIQKDKKKDRYQNDKEYRRKHHESQKKYYINNKESINEKQKEYYENNKESIKEKQKEYNKKNKESIKEKQKEYQLKNSLYEIYYNQLEKYYEDDQLRRDPESESELQVRCKLCTKWFNPTNRSVRQRILSINGQQYGDGHLYCSEECKNACPLYNLKYDPNEKKDPNETGRDPQIQAALRKMTLERDEYTCIRCGLKDITGKNLICHHMEGIRQNAIESADIDICITLCYSCDAEVHSEPGCTRYDMRCDTQSNTQSNTQFRKTDEYYDIVNQIMSEI